MSFKILLSFIVAVVVALMPQVKSTVYYNSVAMDRSGKVVYASNTDGIYVSTDAGATWTKTSSTCGTTAGLDISNDGQYAMAVYDPAGLCGPVQVSNNFGKTWTKPSFPLRTNTVIDGDVSGDGKIMFVANLASGNGNDEIFVSSDYGASFHAVPRSDSINLYSTVMSQAGDRMYVGQSAGILFLSKDFGSTFGPVTTVPYTGYYSTMSCNADCTYMLAVGLSTVTLSTDAGTTWNSTAISKNTGYKTVINDNGQYMFASGYHGKIQRSTDYGVTWATADNSPLTNWVSMDCDSTGQHIVASSSEKGIYLSSDYGVTYTLSKF